MEYQRITFKPEGAQRSRSVILRNPTVTNRLTSGVEVHRDAEEVSGKGFDERIRIIDNELISRRQRLVLNLHYGLLVAEGEVI